MGENATYTTKMSVRHILIIVTGIMITVGCSALVFSTWSAFQAVVPEILGVEKATWAFYVTILYLASAFSAPFIGKILANNDMRVILSASVLLVGLAREWNAFLRFRAFDVGEALSIPPCCSMM